MIAVIIHDGFLRVGVSGRKFGNAGFRIFEFENDRGGLGTCRKGVWGWLSNDFKYVPKEGKPSEEVVKGEL